MDSISEFETRIATALDRIRKGIDDVASSRADAGAPQQAETAEDVQALRSRLDDEKTANAQLEERVKILKERQDDKINSLTNRVSKWRKRSVVMERELQQLRQVNAELRDINDQLRQSAQAGVSEPHLINKAMLAELEALRANRAADAAEMDAILEELRPILEEEASDAAG